MLNNLTLRVTTLSLTLLLTACQLTGNQPVNGTDDTPVTSLSGPWLERKQALENLEKYQARGKFAYITANKTNSANFAWYQNQSDEYRLLLTTPFGNRVVELNVTPTVTQLTDDNNKIHLNSDAETLIYQLTGMNIPINSLRQWLVGLPGDSTDYRLDKNYRITELNFAENGLAWHVKYLGYNDKTNPVLPTDLEIAQSGQKIKLRVSNWDLQ